jgi:hypothetical protein
MITFNELIHLGEMASRQGSYKDSGFSNIVKDQTDEWNSIKDKDDEYTRLLVANIDNKYSIWYTPSTYYLVDKDDNYLGYIKKINVNSIPNGVNNSKTFIVGISYSKIKGFYSIMFKALLYNGFGIILGDTMQTDESINSWKRILKDNKDLAIVYNGKSLEKYNDNIDYCNKEHIDYRVGLYTKAKELK